MKLYLAGSCAAEQRSLMKGIAKELRKAGYEVYCPFELKIPNAWDYTQEEWARLVFEADIKAIDKSDAVIVITPGRIGSAGTNFEQGYAYAKGKHVLAFQYTNEPTSLMTYCGCDTFLNVYESAQVIAGLLIERLKRHDMSGQCLTTLT